MPLVDARAGLLMHHYSSVTSEWVFASMAASHFPLRGLAGLSVGAGIGVLLAMIMQGHDGPLFAAEMALLPFLLAAITGIAKNTTA